MNELPQRKQVRLKEYDYSQEGYYYITICTKDRKQILSKILCKKTCINNKQIKPKTVGVALLGDPQIKLTKEGKIVKKHIENCNKKFKNIKINNYIIMPNHIHLIIELLERVAEDADPYNTKNNKFIQINCYKRNRISYMAEKLL